MSEVETIKINDIWHKNGSTEFHLWQDDDGWYSCRSGEYRGLYSESDDLGPFDTRQEALEAQRADFDAACESAKNDKFNQ